MKKAIMSDCKDPENRSSKYCVCGSHSIKAKRSKKNKIQRLNYLDVFLDMKMKKALLLICLLMPIAVFAQSTKDTSFFYFSRTTSSPITATSNHVYDKLLINAGGANVNCINIPDNSTNITITHCYLVNSHTGSGAIHIGANCSNITIMYNFIATSYRGVNVVKNGTPVAGSNIHINYNRFYNIADAAGHPNGGGSSVQFNNITGPGLQVNYNDILTTIVSPEVGDVLNFYQSNGTSGSRMQMLHNCIEGGSTLSAGKSGVIGGDVGGSWQDIEYNTMVNSGAQAGQVTGGHDITMSNNVGFGAYTSYGYEGFASGNFGGITPYNNTVANNRAKWFNRNGSRLDFYYSSGGGNPLPAGWSTNVSDNTLTAGILPFPLFATSAPTVTAPHITYSPRTQSGTYGIALTPMVATNTGGSVVTWTAGTLPTGVSFSAGTISGTPRQVGTFVIPISATNSSGVSRDTVTLTIAKKNLTISAISTSKQQGAGNPALQYSYNGGLVNGDTSVSGVSVSTTAVTGSPVGSYPITLSGASSAVYNITLIAGSLTVYSGVLIIGYTAVIL